jgi:hypothetical protein
VLELFLSFWIYLEGFRRQKKISFLWNVNVRFAYLVSKTIPFYTLMPKYVSFCSDFVIFLSISERNTFYFPFDHSELSIKRFVSTSKRIGFMHVDITNYYSILKCIDVFSNLFRLNLLLLLYYLHISIKQFSSYTCWTTAFSKCLPVTFLIIYFIFPSVWYFALLFVKETEI